jgi:hypothetical protein
VRQGFKELQRPACVTVAWAGRRSLSVRREEPTRQAGVIAHTREFLPKLGARTMFIRLTVAVVVGALAACTTTETRTVMVPTPVDDACASYGYAPGTTPYNICVEREAAARRRGRMAADYAQERLVADAQDACFSYGLTRGSDRYDRCVQREIDHRRHL